MPTLMHEKFSEQLRNACEGVSCSNHIVEISMDADEFPQFLKDVAETLREQGLDGRLIKASLLVLCGVPIRPLTLLF